MYLGRPLNITWSKVLIFEGKIPRRMEVTDLAKVRVQGWEHSNGNVSCPAPNLSLPGHCLPKESMCSEEGAMLSTSWRMEKLAEYLMPRLRMIMCMTHHEVQITRKRAPWCLLLSSPCSAFPEKSWLHKALSILRLLSCVKTNTTRDEENV